MKNVIKAGLIILSICCTSFKAGTREEQGFCGLKNIAFKADEKITMKVYYSALGAYIGAGEAVFTTGLERYNGKTVYHCVGEGKTYSFFDNFFKVRDRYESYIDTASVFPYKFVRNVDEGGYKIYNNVTFNQEAGTAISSTGAHKISNCIQDVISAVYYARNIDFSKFKANDKIPFDIFLDDEVYHLYLRYIGKEKIKTRFGKFNAIKLKALLISGNVFDGGEKMSLWVSDDPNHLPLRVQSPIAVGSIKVDMSAYKNLRYPLTSLISAKE